MDYINTIPLNGTITAYTPTGLVDVYNKPTSYTKTEHNAAIFDARSETRDNYKKDTNYTTVIYVKDEVSDDALIFIGSTTETNPDSILTKEIQRYKKMKDVTQTIKGYKLWL